LWGFFKRRIWRRPEGKAGANGKIKPETGTIRESVYAPGTPITLFKVFRPVGFASREQEEKSK